MTELEEVRQVYREYEARIGALRQSGRITGGLLGMGGGPAADSCNDRFIDALRERLQAVAREGLPEEELVELLDYIYEVPARYRDDRVIYWMFLAVQGLTEPLVRQLSPACARGLLQSYQGRYRPFERLPAQKNILRVLKERARAGEMPAI